MELLFSLPHPPTSGAHQSVELDFERLHLVRMTAFSCCHCSEQARDSTNESSLQPLVLTFS